MYYYDFHFPLDPSTLFYARNGHTLSPSPSPCTFVLSLSLSLPVHLSLSPSLSNCDCLFHELDGTATYYYMASWLTEPNLPSSICCVAVLRFDGELTSTLCLGTVQLLLQLGTIGLAF